MNANITPFERKFDINNQYNAKKTYVCNLCNAEFSQDDDTFLIIADRLSRHEDWHNTELPYVAKNRIGGKVEWSLK